MTPADLRDLLDILDALGILPDVKSVRYQPAWPTVIGFTTCAAYRTCVAAHKAKDSTRLLGSARTPHRASDADCGAFIAGHICWPWLDCWGES